MLKINLESTGKIFHSWKPNFIDKITLNQNYVTEIFTIKIENIKT